jgi:hypothetical protein
MKSKFSQQNIKKTVSGSLIIWLSGIVFLFCCEMPMAQASWENCPLAKTQHCSKQITGESVSESAAIESKQQTLECCRILPLVFDKARKIEKIQKSEAAQTIVKIFQPVFSSANRQFPAPDNFQPFIVNRENTHLINCIFRI